MTRFGEATRLRLRARHGAALDAWWETLPTRVTSLAAAWGLALGEPIERGNTSLLLRCTTRDGRAAVLKLAPDPELAAEEGRALRTWGTVVPDVLEEAEGALLLEAIEPGDPARRPAFDAVDWAIRLAEGPRDVEHNLDALAPAVGGDRDRLAGWCTVFALLLPGFTTFPSGEKWSGPLS